jgi:hypothetical protein
MLMNLVIVGMLSIVLFTSMYHFFRYVRARVSVCV